MSNSNNDGDGGGSDDGNEKGANGTTTTTAHGFVSSLHRIFDGSGRLGGGGRVWVDIVQRQCGVVEACTILSICREQSETEEAAAT